MKLSWYARRLIARNQWPTLFALVLISFTVFAKPVQVNQPVFRYQIAFDISQSMQVEDVSWQGQSISRLGLAKHHASVLLQNLPCGSHIGWSVFTGRRTLTLLTPLDVCKHFSGLRASLEQIDVSMRWSNGSIIGKGVHQLMRAAHELEAETSVLFFSDGHEAPPMEQGQRGMPNTEKFKVDGLLIGVGGNTPVPIPKIAPDGSPVGFWSAEEVVQKPGMNTGEELSRRQDAHLSMLAGLAKLAYHPMTSESAFIKAATEKRFSRPYESAYDYRWILAVVALLLLLFRFMPAVSDLRSSRG